MQHFSSEMPFEIGGTTILPQTIWIIGILVAIVGAFIWFFNYTMI